jgi:type IV pilus assembly protein PilA
MSALPPLPPPPQALPEAPGAKAARTCGLLSILFAVTCAGIPVAIVLGIVALVQQAKAKRLAGELPLEYRKPTASGLVLGIVGLVLPVLMLPVVGIVAAIAIPAYVSHKDRALDQIVVANLGSELNTLVEAYQKGKEVGLDQPALQASLESLLQSAQEKNPVNPQAPAFRYSISVVSAASAEEAEQYAQEEAATLGEVVFVVAFPPEPQQPGYLAGAALLKMPVNGSITTSQAVTLD